MISHNNTILENPVSIDDLTQQFATSGIYVIYNTYTDTFYIGQATIIINRLLNHFELLETNKHANKDFQREYNEFGRNKFVCDVLLDMPDSTKIERLRQETREIQRYKIAHRRLYNKVLKTIVTKEPVPSHKHNSTPVEDEDVIVTQRMVKREREEVEPKPATCEDCGMMGILFVHIYECDDKKTRCEDCVERRLASWRIQFSERDQQIIDRKSETAYFRWLLNERQHINEQLASALTRFIEKHGQVPDKMYVNGIKTPSEFEGIQIRNRRITPYHCLDMPIV